MDSSTIRVLYENVLHDDVQANRIKESDIRTAINNMKEVYKPDPTSLQSEVVHVAHYNDAAHRCAYLHKYAPLHTALVSEMLQLAMMHNAHIFQAIVNKHGCFNVCSLGGGPGNDVIAVLDVLHSVLGYFEVNATIVDIMVGWKYTFESILRELQDGDYGPISEHCSEQYLSWSYEEANLLSKMTSGSNKAISSANLITMVKFVSASSCKDTSTMIGKIFRSMKQGALVLYIDNAGGGFHQLVTQEAAACNLVSVFGPLKHYLYSNVDFNVKRFGYTPCLETTVTIHLLRKPLPAECSDSFYYNSSYLDSHTVTGVVSKPSNNPQRRSRSQSRSRHQNKRGQSGSRGQLSNNKNPKRSQSQPRVSNRSSLPADNNPRKSLVDIKEAQAVGVVNKATNGAVQTTLADFLAANNVNNSGQSSVDITGYYQATNTALQSWLSVLQSNALQRNNPGASNVNNPRIFQVDNKQAEALDVIQKATNRAVQSWLTDCRGNSLIANNPNNPGNTAQLGTKKAGPQKTSHQSTTTVNNRPHTQYLSPVLRKKLSVPTNDAHNSRKTLLDNRQPGTVNISSKVANGIKNSTKYQPDTKQPGAANKYTPATNNANALRKAQLDSKVPVASNANALRKAQLDSKVPVTNNVNALRRAQLDSKTMPAAQSRSSTSTPVDNYLHTRGTYSALSNTNFPIYSQPTAQRNSAYYVSPGTANSTAPTMPYQQQPATPRPVATNDDSWSDNNCCCIIS